MSVLVCGEPLYDVFVADATANGFALDARIGGSALNVASGLARLGQRVALLTGVSTDGLGERLVQFMTTEGIGTHTLKRVDAPTTLAFVGTGPDGSPAYRFYGAGAADRLVEPADVPPLDGVDALVFGCFSLVTRPTGDTFLGIARNCGDRLVVLDPNVRLSAEPDPLVWRTTVDAFAAHTDLLKVSREDIAAVWGVEPAEIAARWLTLGVAVVVVTDGANGSTLWTGGAPVHVPARPTSVIDTVGAGDSFLAALLTALFERGLASGAALATIDQTAAVEALEFASVAAAVTCSRRGADLPRRAELERG